MNYPARKKNRLDGFDYSSPNAYFITICTHQKKCLFWEAVGATIGRPHELPLNAAGKTVQAAIAEVHNRYPSCVVDHAVVMPNHIHILLRLLPSEDGRPMVAPTISRIVAQMKGAVTKQLGSPVWQKGFHDHVIRTAHDYRMVWEYIENNPLRWAEDSLFVPPHE